MTDVVASHPRSAASHGAAAALDEGIAGVSMNRVAAQLGTAAMSLCRYVSAKDELIALTVDEAYGAPPQLPEPGEDWRGLVCNQTQLEASLQAAEHASATEAVGADYGPLLRQLTDPEEFPAVHAAIAAGAFDEGDGNRRPRVRLRPGTCPRRHRGVYPRPRRSRSGVWRSRHGDRHSHLTAAVRGFKMCKRLITLLVSGAVLFVAACANTVQGVEEDVQRGVEEVEQELQKEDEEG